MFVSQGPNRIEIVHANLGDSRRPYFLRDYYTGVSRVSRNYKRLCKCPRVMVKFSPSIGLKCGEEEEVIRTWKERVMWIRLV